MGKLEGKVAVITGGNSGMGLATARRFVAEGAYVFITGRRQAELDSAVGRIGRNVTGVQGDVANPADLDRLYAAWRSRRARSTSCSPTPGSTASPRSGRSPRSTSTRSSGSTSGVCCSRSRRRCRCSGTAGRSS